MKWSPKEYSEMAVIANDAGEELLTRLDWLTIQPQVIVDVGSGDAMLTRKLQARFPQAQVIALENSQEMLSFSQFPTSVCADALQLPFNNQTVDIIFANLVLPWLSDPLSVFQEWRRVLKPEGVLLFTAFGPDTLRDHPHRVPQCLDMHDVGDALLQVGFSDPVLDVNHCTVAYRCQDKLQQELFYTGMIAEVAQTEIASLEVMYELVYAHAFSPGNQDTVTADADGVARIPISMLRQKLRVVS